MTNHGDATPATTLGRTQLSSATHLDTVSAYGMLIWDWSDARLDEPVRACSPWRVRDVVHHLGNIACFVRACLDARGPEPEFTDVVMPADDALIEWASQEWDRVVGQLAAADPDAPAWNWSLESDVVAFWPRCLTHEAVVHAWDVADAVDEHLAISVEVAADGIDEILAVHLPSGTHHGRRFTRAGRVQVRTTDSGHRWLVETTESRVRATSVAIDTPGLDDLAGTATALYLDLWGRHPLPLAGLQRQWADQLAASPPHP